MKTGFTLIELLVVVLIMGILASIALPQYQMAVAKARYVKMMPLVKALKHAEEEYWYMHREYAYDFAELGFDVKGFKIDKEPQGSAEEINRKAGITNQRRNGLTSSPFVALRIDENKRAPVVSGYVSWRGKNAGYVIYLDHDNVGRPANHRGERWCYFYTYTNAWPYKLCATLTGTKPQMTGDGWAGPSRFQFPK